MISNVTFRGETPATTKTEPTTITEPPKPQKEKTAISSSVDKVSFSGSKKKKELEYEKTHFYTIFGAIAGGVLGALGMIRGKGGIVSLIGGPIVGVLAGLLGDFAINKTVQNTTQSVLNNLNKEG